MGRSWSRGGRLALACVGLLAGGSAAQEAGGPKTWDGTRVLRTLDVADVSFQGQAGYAGLVLHRDGHGVPVITWIAVDRDGEGLARKLFVDRNGDSKLELAESYPLEVTFNEQVKRHYATLTLPELDVGGVRHRAVRLMILGDPVRQGFYLNLNVGGSSKHYMRSGWNPATGKVATMSTSLAAAPVFDFILAGELVIHCNKFTLPLEGLGYVMYTVMTKGWGDNATTQVGQNVLPAEDFAVELTYPTEHGQAIWKARINKVC